MAITESWLPAENFVRNGVRGNYKKALAVSYVHFYALTAASGDARINDILTLYTPYHNNLVASAIAKSGSKGSQKSATAGKNDMFTSLTTQRLPVWMQMIGNVYQKGTPSWINLFPKGMKDYNSGSIEEKLLALATLMGKVDDDGALTAVASLINAFNAVITGSRNNQENYKTIVELNISNEQSAIEAMCIQQFADYGAIVSLFPNLPNTIKSFIAVSELQQKVHGATYVGKVNAKKTKCYVTKKATDATKIIVTCDVDCQVWVNSSIHNPAHPAGVFVPANTPTEGKFPDLGNSVNRVFQIQNLNLTKQGNYSIEFI